MICRATALAFAGLWGVETAAQGLELSVDAATLTWQQGQQDLTVKVNLQNKGSSFNIWAGTFYVGVSGGRGINVPKIHDVKLAGAQNTAQFLNGSFLTGISGNQPTQWTQIPLQTSDPDAQPNIQGAQPVSSFNTSEIAVTFDRVGGTDGTAQTIPGNTTAPFAEITLRRSGDLNAAGFCTLNFFNTPPAEPSFLVMSSGGNKTMSMTSATVLAAFPSQTVNELTPLSLSLSLSETDADIPAPSLTYRLVTGPTGMTVTEAGALAWTPTEAQGPSTHSVLVAMTDGVATVTNSLRVVVNEVNAAPLLATIADRTIDELKPLSLSLSATDADIPVQPLTYRLISGPPGMTVNAAGALAWTPTEAQGPSTSTVLVAVTDGVAEVTNS
ncbi:MAG: hypothetical protein WCR07_11680, partial [Verrucomicrobiota bacterium]